MKNKRLKGLGIFNLEKQRLLEDLTATLKSSKGYYQKKIQTSGHSREISNDALGHSREISNMMPNLMWR